MSHNHSHSHSHHEHDHDDHHEHSHGESIGGKCGCSETVRLSSMLVLITLFFFLEIIAGRITNSITLVTDSFHMLSDVIALFIALFSVRISKRKSSKNTFGWVRAEILGALINSVFLLALCVSIFLEAIERFVVTETIREVDLLLYVACTGLAINTVGLLIFGHGHSHASAPVKKLPVNLSEVSSIESEYSPLARSPHSPRTNRSNYLSQQNSSININGSTTNLFDNDSHRHEEERKGKCCNMFNTHTNYNTRAVFLHVFADAIGSCVVITSALLNKYHDKLYISSDIIHYVDPTLCLILVAIILTTTIPLLKETAMILLQTVPKEVKLNHLKEDLLKIQGILSIHELHIWKLSGTKIIATCHITCHNLAEYVRIASQVKHLFHEKGIHSTTIQAEFIDDITSEAKSDCIFECVDDCHADTCCGITSSLRVRSNQQQHINHNNDINSI